MSAAASAKKQNAVIVNPSGPVKKVLIFLHGLGDTGSGWSDILSETNPDPVSTKIICPHAPTMPITLNAGFEMPAWFDLYDLGNFKKQDEAGIKRSSKFLSELVATEASALPNGTRDIVIGGFSQGGAVALHTLFTSDVRLGGAAVLSTWLPLHEQLLANKDKLPAVNKQTPILYCHGRDDPMVAFPIAQLSSQMISSQLGFPALTFKTYEGLVHSSCPAEMADLKNWLKNVFSAQ